MLLLLVPLVALLAWSPRAAAGEVGDLYCGKDDCYGLLGLKRDADSSDVKKAYRQLAKKWHPDKNKSPGATETFRKISRANEVLSDEKLRHAYDYFLDHPEDRYTHYYRYYDAVYAPKTPIWMVVTGLLLFLSSLQYVNQQWRYARMMRAIRYQPSFKRRVNELCEAEIAAMKQKPNKAEKEVLKEQIENRVMDTEVECGGQAFAKPALKSLIGVKAVMSPVTISMSIYANARWFWRFSVCKEEYGEEEKIYLTRKALGISEGNWQGVDEANRQDYVSRQLWVKKNLLAFYAEQQEEMMQKRAQSGAYKRAKRWMRNH